MSVCVKIVIKIEIEKKIVIYIFCPYRTALVGTKLFRAVALQELSLTHLGYGPINLKLGVLIKGIG